MKHADIRIVGSGYPELRRVSDLVPDWRNLGIAVRPPRPGAQAHIDWHRVGRVFVEPSSPSTSSSPETESAHLQIHIRIAQRSYLKRHFRDICA